MSPDTLTAPQEGKDRIDYLAETILQDLEPMLLDGALFTYLRTRDHFDAQALSWVLGFLEKFSERVRFTVKQASTSDAQGCSYHHHVPHDVVVYVSPEFLSDAGLLRAKLRVGIPVLVQSVARTAIALFDEQVAADIVEYVAAYRDDYRAQVVDKGLLPEAPPLSGPLQSFAEIDPPRAALRGRIVAHEDAPVPVDRLEYVPDGFSEDAVDRARVCQTVETTLLPRIKEKWGQRGVEASDFQYLDCEAVTDAAVERLQFSIRGILKSVPMRFTDGDSNPFLRAWDASVNYARLERVDLSAADIIHTVLIEHAFYHMLIRVAPETDATASKPLWGEFDTRRSKTA